MKRVICGLLITCTLLFSSCVAETKSSGETNKPFVVYSIESMPKDLLMLNRRAESEEDLLYALFEGLVSMDKGGNITPAIAENWQVSDDKLEYRFVIRDTAKWSDGNNITAQDFVNFFSEILNKKIDNIFFTQLSSIYGADDYHNGKVKVDGVAIKADGEKNLIIRLNYPCIDFLKILSQPIYGLRSGASNLQSWKKNYSEIKYSGPFAITNVDEQNNVTLERNMYYWNKDCITDDKLSINEKGSKELALAEYETSKVDVITDPPISEVGRLIKSSNTIVVNSLNKIGIAFNFSQKSIGSEKNFRKAIWSSVDSDTIAEKALNEFKIPSQNKYGESVNVFKNTTNSKGINLNAAKDYIAQINPDKLKNIKLVALNTDKNRRISKALKENMESNLGINIKISLLEEYELTETIKKQDFDIILTEFVTDYDENISSLERWNSTSWDNYGKYSNESYDSSFRKLKLEKDNSARKIYIEECKKELNEDIPYVYLYNDVKIISKSFDISGLDVNIFGNLDFRNIHRITDK